MPARGLGVHAYNARRRMHAARRPTQARRRRARRRTRPKAPVARTHPKAAGSGVGVAEMEKLSRVLAPPVLLKERNAPYVVVSAYINALVAMFWAANVLVAPGVRPSVPKSWRVLSTANVLAVESLRTTLIVNRYQSPTVNGMAAELGPFVVAVAVVPSDAPDCTLYT